MYRSILSFSAAASITLAACTKVVHSVNSKAAQAPAVRVTPSILINGVERKPVVITISGTGSAGNMPGRGGSATFNNPFGLAVDKQGNFYLADAANNVIKKMTPGGTITNYAGTGAAGFNDADAGSAKFNNPTAVAVDTAGNVYVADRNNQRIRKIDGNGMVSTIAGIADSGYTPAGPALSSQFHNPTGIAVDIKGNVYIADEGNNRIRRVSTSGICGTYAGSGDNGTGDGIGETAIFSLPAAVALDPSGNLYVADRGNNQIRKIDPSRSVTTLAGSLNTAPGNTNGNGTNAQFNGPAGIAVDSFNIVYVADAGNNLIRQITPAADVTTIAGNGVATFKDGKAADASFNNPAGLAVDKFGDVYVADRNNQRVRALMVVPAVTTFSGTGVAGFTAGAANVATFNAPWHMALQGTTIWLVDHGNNAIRQVDGLTGTVSTLHIGVGTPGYNPGSFLGAQFNAPYGIAVDGSVYIADQLNNMLRYFSYPNVYTDAGKRTAGYVDGAKLNAQFDRPAGIAIDRNHNVIIADQGNNRIRKSEFQGGITTIAGNSASGFTDGTGAAAQFSAPAAVVVDDSNNIFVADYGNNAIRKITPAGIVTTLAGGTQGFRDGNGRDAQFSLPSALAIDAAGTIYVADMWNNKIRMVTKAGVVTTLAGYGYQGYEEGPGPLSQFKFPTGIAVGADGKVYVSDSWNNVIRVIQ